MSNILAGVGRGQLACSQRTGCAASGKSRLNIEMPFANLLGIELMPQAGYGLHSNWLSCFLIDEVSFGINRDDLIQALEEANIEARPVWKPMHLQKLYRDADHYGGDVAEELFARGICLPSSSNMSEDDQAAVIQVVQAAASPQRQLEVLQAN